MTKSAIDSNKHPFHIKASEFTQTNLKTHDITKGFRLKFENPIELSIGRVIGFDTVMVALRASKKTKEDKAPVHVVSRKAEHIVGFIYIQRRLANGTSYSAVCTRYTEATISKEDLTEFTKVFKHSPEESIVLKTNERLVTLISELSKLSKDLSGKKGIVRKDLRRPVNPAKPLPVRSSVKLPVIPKEIERKFLPAVDKVNSSWINQVLEGFSRSSDINQSWVKLDTVKFHIAEDTVFFESLNKTMHTPITPVEVGVDNCNILREIFASTIKKSVRIRKQDQDFFFTIKLDVGKLGECIEIEVPIELQTYQALKMYCGREISKFRLDIMHDGMKYEVDIFKNNLANLILIELEVPKIDHPVNLPAWVGIEVTGDPTYFNSNMVRYNSYTNGKFNA